MSRQLAVIRRDAPLQIGLDQLRLPPLEAARPVFRRLEFGSLLERLPQPAQMEPDLAQPEDVADQVLAACSGLLDFGTGTVLNADGGFHLRRL